ncbi:MAG: zinc-binding dehydrogenase [Chloroflexota bacterium]
MKAGILKEVGRFAIEELPMPKAKPDSAVVKVKYCAVCGADLGRFKRETNFGVGLMGHEFCGELVEVGSELTGWKVGDRVTVDPITYCHQCYYCLSGRQNLCRNRKVGGYFDVPGAYAEYIEVLPEQLFRTPEGMDDKKATMTQCLAVSLHGVKMAEVKLLDNVIVIGAGPIGLMALLLVKAMGAGQTIVFAKGEGRKKVSKKLGADHVIDAKDIGERDEVNKLTNGIGADVVLECSGGADAFINALTMARVGGRVTIVGGYKGPSTIHTTDIYQREVTVNGSLAYTHEEFGEALELIARGMVNVDPLITSIEPLDNIQAGFERLRELGDEVKVVIAPTGKV